MSTATYILNKCLTKKLEGIIPEERWSGVKSNFSILKMFGSITHRHVFDQLKWKLDDKSSQMILIEYHSTGGYKLFDPLNKQVLISRDVIIDGLKKSGWKDNVKKGYVGILCDEPINEADRGTRQEEIRVLVGTRRTQRTRNMPARMCDYIR